MAANVCDTELQGPGQWEAGVVENPHPESLIASTSKNKKRSLFTHMYLLPPLFFMEATTSS
jgi:hypothetical protein